MRALGVTDCRWANIQKHVHVVRKEVELGALSATVVAAAALPRPPVKRDRDRPAESDAEWRCGHGSQFLWRG